MGWHRCGRKTYAGRVPHGRLTNQRGIPMERVTLRIPKQQIEEVEQMVDSGQFPNRSEAIRSAVREMISDQHDARGRKRNKPWAKV